jgi:LysR family transcriptional regulator for bpeEF and oprC
MAQRTSHDSLDGIVVFVKVAQSASFSEAARHLGLSASGVSRAITRLGSRLGTRLVNRTTRRLSLAPEGTAFIERCRRLLADLEDAEAEASEVGNVPRGPLRIQVPRGFGRTVVVPSLVEFLARYPEVTVDISVNDGAIDPAEEEVDASFVLGEPATGSFIAHKICSIGYAVCASPDYLRQHGEPRQPDDLTSHRCLNYVQPRTGRQRDWTLTDAGTDAGKAISVTVPSVLHANDIHAVHQAAVSGAGLAYLMDFLIDADVDSGRLKIVMPEYARRGVPIHVCYPRNRHQPRRLTAFVTHPRDALRAEAAWSIERLIGPINACLSG